MYLYRHFSTWATNESLFSMYNSIVMCANTIAFFTHATLIKLYFVLKVSVLQAAARETLWSHEIQHLNRKSNKKRNCALKFYHACTSVRNLLCCDDRCIQFIYIRVPVISRVKRCNITQLSAVGRVFKNKLSTADKNRLMGR